MLKIIFFLFSNKTVTFWNNGNINILPTLSKSLETFLFKEVAWINDSADFLIHLSWFSHVKQMSLNSNYLENNALMINFFKNFLI